MIKCLCLKRPNVIVAPIQGFYFNLKNFGASLCHYQRIKDLTAVRRRQRDAFPATGIPVCAQSSHFLCCCCVHFRCFVVFVIVVFVVDTESQVLFLPKNTSLYTIHFHFLVILSLLWQLWDADKQMLFLPQEFIPTCAQSGETLSRNSPSRPLPMELSSNTPGGPNFISSQSHP